MADSTYAFEEMKGGDMDHYLEAAKRLVSQMTLEEKGALTSGEDFWHTKSNGRLKIPSIAVADGPNGLRKVVEEGGSGRSVPATCFPTSSAMAATWNLDLVRKVGEALGEEAAAMGVQVLLGPGVNMKRSPLGGRNFEYFSEDPILAGQLAAAFIRGVQSRDVGTSLKHFAANNQELERMASSSNLDEQTLFEIYLTAFELAVEAAPWTVMCAYNQVNGIYASEHSGLLTDILRKRFGFKGVVVSDWGAVHDRVAGVNAGLNLEMPGNGGINDRRVVEAVKSGTLDEKVLDRVVIDTVSLCLKADALKPKDATFDIDAHHRLARKVAAEAAVLLKNDDAVLPIDPGNPPTLAVIGAFAKSPRYQGAGSAEVNPTRLDNAYDALAESVPSEKLRYAPGYEIGASPDSMLIAEAAKTASECDLAIVFAGLPDSDESEGFDRNHIDLPRAHLELIEAVSAKNSQTVVVLMNGSAVAMPFASNDRVKAVLEVWLGGQAGGGAVADLLLGKANPSGKLAETFPIRLEDTPCFMSFPGRGGRADYGEGMFIGYRYYDKKKVAPLYPFGYGLSYTSFRYKTLELSADTIRDIDGLTVTVTVQNEGAVFGKEVVQLYVADSAEGVVRPIKSLKGFAKVALAPGEEKTVCFQLGYRDFAYYSEQCRDWCVADGKFEIRVGGSSVDLPLVGRVQVTSTHPDIAMLTRDSMVKLFENHPQGHAVYQSVFSTVMAHFKSRQAAAVTPTEKRAQKRAARMEVAVVRDLPFYRLATLFGHLFSESKVAELLKQAGINC